MDRSKKTPRQGIVSLTVRFSRCMLKFDLNWKCLDFLLVAYAII